MWFFELSQILLLVHYISYEINQIFVVSSDKILYSSARHIDGTCRRTDVPDLSKEVSALADVTTFHSLCALLVPNGLTVYETRTGRWSWRGGACRQRRFSGVGVGIGRRDAARPVVH